MPPTLRGYLTPADLSREPTIYLVPACSDPEEERTALQAFFPTIFEERLEWLVAGSNNVAAALVLRTLHALVLWAEVPHFDLFRAAASSSASRAPRRMLFTSELPSWHSY
jgi:hypothetical protein